MRGFFKYTRNASGQDARTLTQPTAGLNEYLPSVVIGDTLMSDIIDVTPYRDDCVLFNSNSAITKIGEATLAAKGTVRACIHSDESTSALDVFYTMVLKSGTPWTGAIIKHTTTIATSAVAATSYAMTFDTTPTSAPADSSSTVFKTEADTYYVFSNSQEKRLHFVKHNSTADSYGYVDIPAYPKKLVSHANRVFFIDTNNKFWWCRGGDVYSWYSMEYDDNAIVTTRNCANAAYDIAAQPNVTRQITATVTTTDTADTLGILTIVGTNGVDGAQTATLTLSAGLNQTSMAFKTITSITQSGWTQGGATPDTIVVGVAPVGLGFVTDDAGFWTVERETSLNDICVLGNSLYIFADNNIYIFRGYSYDTFSLSPIISNVGIEKMSATKGHRKLATVHNMAYFLYDGSVYEFNGNDQPRIVSRPVILNNQSSNGVMGGIDFSGANWVLTALAEELYMFDHTGATAYYYMFEFETKTWWKFSGFTATNISAASTFNFMYIPSYDRQELFNVISENDTQDYYYSKQLGCTQGTAHPFMITKAFNSYPSETGSLTDVVLQVKGVSTYTADITVQYSLTDDADDFIDIKAYDNYIFNGDVEILSIPVPIGNIANAHHYRLKIIIGSSSHATGVYLFNIERRFRIIGRSR